MKSTVPAHDHLDCPASSSDSSSCFSAADSPASSSPSSVDSSPELPLKRHDTAPASSAPFPFANVALPAAISNVPLSKSAAAAPSTAASRAASRIPAPAKSIFVEALVNSTTLIIEAMWSFSTESECYIHKAMPLDRFIHETLRRARTSYSTLQLALYYLILIKPYIFDTREHNAKYKIGVPSGISPQLRCGRRAFLTALMLASKYSQDRNYSVAAWSKISGLGVKELCDNEVVFLKAVDWNLFVNYNVYERWSQVLFECAAENEDEYESPSDKRVVWIERFRVMDTNITTCHWASPKAKFISTQPSTLSLSTGSSSAPGKKRLRADVNDDDDAGHEGDDETECTRCSRRRNSPSATTANSSISSKKRLRISYITNREDDSSTILYPSARHFSNSLPPPSAKLNLSY